MRRSVVYERHRQIYEWYHARIDQLEVPGPGANPVIMDIINRFWPDETDDSIRAYCGMGMSAAWEDTYPEVPWPRIYDPTEPGYDGPTLARTWLGFGQRVRLIDLKMGDICIFKRDTDITDGEVHGHVGCFLGFYGNPDGSLRGLRLLGANQGNGIKPYGYRFNDDGNTVGISLNCYAFGRWLGARRYT